MKIRKLELDCKIVKLKIDNSYSVELTNVQTLKTLLENYRIHPNKILGQNFLVDKKALDDLIDAADIKPKDAVLEVGGGVGTITRELARHAKKVVVVEKDKRLIPILRENTKGFGNTEIVEGDILKLDISTPDKSNPLFNSPPYFKGEMSRKAGQKGLPHYKLIGTPPYYLTNRLLRKFLQDVENKPQTITLIIQKEVAEKIAAKPPDMNLLALSAQLYGAPKIVRRVPRSAFWPQPDVDSALIHIEVKKLIVSKEEEQKFWQIVKKAFSQPRKQLSTTLGVSDPRRPQELSVEEWLRLIDCMLSPS